MKPRKRNRSLMKFSEPDLAPRLHAARYRATANWLYTPVSVSRAPRLVQQRPNPRRHLPLRRGHKDFPRECPHCPERPTSIYAGHARYRQPRTRDNLNTSLLARRPWEPSQPCPAPSPRPASKLNVGPDQRVTPLHGHGVTWADSQRVTIEHSTIGPFLC